MHISYFVSDFCHYDGRRCMKVAAAGVVIHWRQQGKWWRCDHWPACLVWSSHLHIILFVYVMFTGSLQIFGTMRHTDIIFSKLAFSILEDTWIINKLAIFHAWYQKFSNCPYIPRWEVGGWLNHKPIPWSYKENKNLIKIHPACGEGKGGVWIAARIAAAWRVLTCLRNCLLFIVISAKSTNFTTNTRYHVESSVMKYDYRL